MKQRNITLQVKKRSKAIMFMLFTCMTVSFMLFAGAWLSVPALWMSWMGILLFSTLLVVYLSVVLTKNKTSKQAPD